MLQKMDKMYFTTCLKLTLLKNAAKEKFREFSEDERGGAATVVIEIVMIGMVLVLGFVFRKAIAGLFISLWNNLIHFDGSGDGTEAFTPPSNPFE